MSEALSFVSGKVELVNTLGLKGEQTELFAKLESGGISQEDVDPQCKWSSSQTSYGDCVCQIEGQAGRAVSRFNASTAGPDPNRSEGKVRRASTARYTNDAI